MNEIGISENTIQYLKKRIEGEMLKDCGYAVGNIIASAVDEISNSGTVDESILEFLTLILDPLVNLRLMDTQTYSELAYMARSAYR